MYPVLSEQQGNPFTLAITNNGDNIWLIDEGDYQFLWFDCDGVSFDKGFYEITSGCYHNEPMNDQSKLYLQDCSVKLYGNYRDQYNGQDATVYLYACNSSSGAIKYHNNVPYAVVLNNCWSGSTTDSIGDCIGTIKLNDAWASSEDFYAGVKVVFEDGHEFWAKLDEIPSGSTPPEWKWYKRLIDGVDCYMINLYNNTEVITSTWTEKTPVYEDETADVYLYVDINTSTVCYNAGAFGSLIPAYTLQDNLGYSYNIPGYIGANKDITLMQLSDTDPAGSLSKHFYWENRKITGCREGNEITRMLDGSARIYLKPMVGYSDYWHSITEFTTPYVRVREDPDYVYYTRYVVRIDN